MDLSLIDGIIFDVDGTLYSQKKVRVSMLLRLFLHYLVRPLRIKELLVVYKFRELRETEKWKDAELGAICLYLSEVYHMRKERVSKAVDYWMFKNPLDLLRKYSYKEVVDFACKAREKGVSIIIYSDYPAEDKLVSLGMSSDMVFCFGQHGVDEQKPSEKVMNYIVSTAGIPSGRLLYVGDRDDRDKVSADLVGIRYYDIQDFRKQLRVEGTI